MDKVCSFKIKGMLRDLSVSSFSAEYAYENMNVRIMPTNELTLLSMVNEKGTKLCQYTLLGIPMGLATIDKYLVIFSHDKYSNKPDKITKISIDANNLLDIDMDILYEGNLNLDPKYPIETLSFYENSDIMKVYWTDGKNLPRFINIASSEEVRNKWNDSSFDFLPQLLLKEKVTITKKTNGGNFDAGVILYVLTYYNKYSLQSSIFYISPIYYITLDNAGIAPNKSTSNTFDIEVSNIDKNFDYIRIYSIYTTSLDTNKVIKRVADLAISNNEDNITIISDTGTIGETLSDFDLLYIGSLPIVITTIKDKDNTLFLGDIVRSKQEISELSTIFRNAGKNIISFSSKYITLKGDKQGTSYEYTSQLSGNSNLITHFMHGEVYRFGVLLLDKYGIWTDPIYIDDIRVTGTPSSSSFILLSNDYISIPIITLNTDIITKISNFKKIRPVVVFPNISDRETVCLGILCPTVYNVLDRDTNTPFVLSSWFIRPNAPFDCPKDSIMDGDKVSNDEFKYASYVPINMIHQEEIAKDNFTDYSRGGIMQNSKYKIDTSQGAKYSDTVNKGAWVEFRHNYPIPSSQKRNAEILCLYYLGLIQPVYTNDKSTALTLYTTEFNNYYFIDLSILTFHSPDIEFDPNIQSIDMSNLKLRIIGIVPITANLSSIDISTSTGTQTSSYNNISRSGEGFYKEPIKTVNGFITPGNIYADSLFGWRGLVSGAFWNDYATEAANEVSSLENSYDFIVYPWHRNGSLNNAKFSSERTRPSMLQKKLILNYRYSYRTLYFNRPIEFDFNTTDIKIFNSEEVSNIKLKGPEEIGTINYYGNIDKLITTPPHVKKYKISDLNEYSPEFLDLDGYPIFVSSSDPTGSYEYRHSGFVDNNTEHYWLDSSGRGAYYSLYSLLYHRSKEASIDYTGVDPVRMKYKSTPHAVVSLDTLDHKLVILPTFKGMKNSVISRPIGNTKYYLNSMSIVTINDMNKSRGTGEKDLKDNLFYFFDKKKTIAGVILPVIDLNSYGVKGWIGEYYGSLVTNYTGIECGFLWLAELYNDSLDPSLKFGGNGEEALENNIWIPCGEAVNIRDEEDNLKNNIILYCSLGDTYYLRYDHLKTYPFSSEDQNLITEIISFMCETRVNIDGRYDKNRGDVNIYYTPETFNKLNSVYTLTNNYFKYRIPNPNKLNLNNFHNSITWTKTKTLGELIDSWTNITLASTLDLDGDKGPVRSLKRFNNNLFAFQDKGISLILYNDNVLIASTQGVPIEIANSGKVSGKRYLTEVGCTNKWSICLTPNGLYFIDDITKGIYLFNGLLNNLSDKLGFHSWINSESKSIEPWNPIDFLNFVSYYDKVNGDVFFISKDKCLGFSEPLGLFASFYSYEDTPYFANIQDKGIWIKLDGTLWMHLEGEYNNFFGENKPFYTTIIANPDPLIDKTFNTVEFRADSFKDNKFITTRPFDTLKVWNEYLSGISNFDGDRFAPKNPLRLKFRVWRANIPRSDENYRDRIRNPWAYILLINKGENTNKMLLHDIVVHYFQ